MLTVMLNATYRDMQNMVPHLDLPWREPVPDHATIARQQQHSASCTILLKKLIIFCDLGSKRWRLANKKKQKGQLSQVKKFLSAAEKLSACSVIIPISMDKKEAVTAAGGLVNAGIRSFELWWDSTEKSLQFVLVGEAKDISNFKQAFANMYPNAAFTDLSSTSPEWFDKKSQYQIFDVGTYHGHYTAVFDQTKSHQIITQIANTIQLSKYAWIQFTFRYYSFNAFLRKHVTRLDEKAREIKRGNYLNTSEILLHPDKKPHEHPELGYDFTNNYGGLQKHATLKMQSAHLLMSIRGLIKSDSDLDLHFDEIEALPIENIHSSHEHLTKFRYDYDEFNHENPKKTSIKIEGRKEKHCRLEVFESRLLPDPRPFLDSAVGKYFERGLFSYRERGPLPFLILNLSEIPLFIHLPNPTTPNIGTTRGVSLPVKPSQKAGANIGFFKIKKDFDWQSIWGNIEKSKDIDAAVISPTDFANHFYGVGASGSGKTSLIRLFAKHLESWNNNGKFANAFVYVDPKGDDSHKFIKQCEPDTISGGRVHFLDPQETKFSINPLELPAYQSKEREETVSRYVGYFMKTIEEWYQQSARYVQMERIFRALLFYIYMKHDAPTFLDIHDIILKLQDRGNDALPQIIQTFGTPDPEMRQALTSIATLKGDAFTPLLNRIEQFATDPVLKRMFSVRKGTVNFDEIIRAGRYTVVRISPLNMPQHVQPLAMQAFILKLWFTIQERANKVQDEKDRTQVVLALDEFQIVKDLQVLQLMLEQARSLGLGLILSHQTTEQISDKQLGIITGNSGTQLIGKVNGKDAARIAQIWDPQFQKELMQQFASQEYFHWTIREKAPPGEEQPPPVQFWLNQPPALLTVDEDYDEFVLGQLEKYGSGKVEDTATRQMSAKKSKWIQNISVPFPSQMEWKIMLMLREREMRQADMVDMLKVQNRSEVLAVLKQMISDKILKRTDDTRMSPYALTEKAREDYFDYDVTEIGSAADIEEVTKAAIDVYLKKEMFVTMATQKIRKGQDRTDLVVYDYASQIPISVELESISEVNSHREHVRYNMIKWKDMGFEKCHVWSKNSKIQEIHDALEDKEKKGVKVGVI